LNESITFGVIEPLDGSDLTISHYHTLQLAYYFWVAPEMRTSTVHPTERFLIIQPGPEAPWKAIRITPEGDRDPEYINQKLQLKSTFSPSPRPYDQTGQSAILRGLQGHFGARYPA